MSKVALTYPVVGQKDSTEEPKVTTALQAVETFLNGQKIESTDNIKPGGIEEASLSAAVQTLLNTKSAAALSYVAKNEAAFTAASGELVTMQKNGSTLTLPEPTANRIVGVYCASSINSVKVKPTKAATKIFGDFLGEAGAAEVTLAGSQHVLVQADGANWLIIAGEPRREQAYVAKAAFTKAEAEAGIEPSATRPAMVIVEPTGSWAGGGTFLFVGGINVATGSKETIAGTSPPVTLFVPPGQKWKATQPGNFSTILL